MPFISSFRGPFPPTPENVWLAIILGFVFGTVIAIIVELYFRKKFKKFKS
ncbi:hypothetical protein [Ignicoccus islandicus]|nr:hypothetical protein [Ignicoccus islandicus]